MSTTSLPVRQTRTRVDQGRDDTTERAVLSALNGAFTLDALYALVEPTAAAGREGGRDVVHGAQDTRWRRRVRGLLQTMRRQGTAQRIGDGLWILDGTPEHPRAAVLVSLAGADVELRVSTAVDLLNGIDEPVDLVFADPPYGLGQGAGLRVDTAARTSGAIDRERHLVPGYVDVPPADYRAFTAAWVSAAAGAIRPGGYLCAVTGPQQAAWVQVLAELAGLTYCNSLAIGKVFALRTTRRFAHAHWTATIMCSGPAPSPRRVFTPPPDLPKARSGREYPLDLWPIGDVGRVQHRAGTTRYRNMLPVRLVQRLIAALTRPSPQLLPAGTDRTGRPDLVADPFFGGGTAALASHALRLRYIGADVNPQALPFAVGLLEAQASSTPSSGHLPLGQRHSGTPPPAGTSRRCP